MNTNDYPGKIWLQVMSSDGGWCLERPDWTHSEDKQYSSDIKYIRADIVAVKDDNFRDLAYQHGAALRDVAHYKAEVTRLENIIADMAGELVDACQSRDDALGLNEGEVLWTCDGCGAHGVVPAEWKWVPGWSFDVVRHDGRWYCMGCQEKKGWLVAEENDNG